MSSSFATQKQLEDAVGLGLIKGQIEASKYIVDQLLEEAQRYFNQEGDAEAQAIRSLASDLKKGYLARLEESLARLKSKARSAEILGTEFNEAGTSMTVYE